MKPPVRLMFSMFQNLKPILELMNEHSGVHQIYGKPEIKTIEKDGKPLFVVIEKTAFDSEKDAQIYIDVGARVQSLKV